MHPLRIEDRADAGQQVDFSGPIELRVIRLLLVADLVAALSRARLPVASRRDRQMLGLIGWV